MSSNMTELELIRTEEGGFVMQPKDYRLHVATGEEADQQWPDVKQIEEAAPLFDIPLCWRKIIAEDRLPTEEPEESVIDQNATLMVREIKYHLLASTVRAEHSPSADPSSSDLAKTLETDRPSSIAEEYVDDSEALKSVYGASLLLKLQWEDQSLQKSVPHRTHQQLVSFISDIKESLGEVLEQNPRAGQAVVDAISLELTSVLISRYMEALEMCQVKLERACFELLILCAERASPKEMQVPLRALLKQIDIVYLDATSYLVLQPLLMLWTRVILRMPRYRHTSLHDLLRTYDRMLPCAESYQMSFVSDDEIGVAKPGRISRLCEILVSFFGKLTVLQVKQRNESDAIRLRVDALGRERDYVEESIDNDEWVAIQNTSELESSSSNTAQEIEDKTGTKKEKETSKEKADAEKQSQENCKTRKSIVPEGHKESSKEEVEAGKERGGGNSATENAEETKHGTKPLTNEVKPGMEKKEDSKITEKVATAGGSDKNKIEKDTKDWVLERAMTLSRILNLQGVIWSGLPAPSVENQEMPKTSVKSKEQNVAGIGGEASFMQHEEMLCDCLRMFHGLGWSNPVLVCQIAANGLSLDCCSHSDELLMKHIGDDARSRKERRRTLYSVISVGQYLCGIMRPKTRNMLAGVDDKDVDDYHVEIHGTGFDLLDVYYAFDLVLLYVMALIAQSNRTASMAGVLTIRAFLERLEDSGFESYEDVIRLRTGTASVGREVNVIGLAHHLAEAVASCDDVIHRRVTYETLQIVLRKCKDPHARYMITESIFHDCKHVAVCGQIITEMKDALRYSDSCAASDNFDTWTMEQASCLRSQFVDVCLPRYFMPRKEMLMSISTIVSTAAACKFLAISDGVIMDGLNEIDIKLRIMKEKRMKMMKEYCKLGRECIRALAAVAEHDRKTMPGSSYAKHKLKEAKAIYAASGRTLNQCMMALSLLDDALKYLS